MRFPKKKVSARAIALGLGLGLVGMLVTALPASASTITSFTPACGVAGTVVTITGSGFTGATGVTFNGTPAVTWSAATDTSATATVPAGATSGPIVVETPSADTQSSANYIVAAPGVPTITSFFPISGGVGTSVVITGTHFACPTSVMFNTTAATSYIVNSDTQITATVPTGATTGPLHVTTSGGGPANSATSFTVTGTPTITSFTPTSGPVGTSVTITGTNLLGVTSVKFNGTSATFTTSTATSVTATVPSGATTGKITVTTPGGTATSATDYTVTTAPIARSVSFGFQPHSRVSGQVSVNNGLAACRSLVPVIIQKQKGGSWKWVDTTATRKSGAFKTYIPPSNGTFRAKVNQITLANGVVCAKSISSPAHS